MARICLFALAAAIVLAAVSKVAAAEGFRIHTKIFVGDERRPASETTTLFLDGAVYDFLDAPPQAAVFRKPLGDQPGRFILLDPERRVRTELTTDKLAGAMDKLRTWAGQQRDPFLRFAADPEFDESFDPGSGRLVLASHLENYRAETMRSDQPQALAQYREFLDWYTRLNALLSAGPPPEPRLRLNAALARYRVVPVTVELTRAGDKEKLRAEHDFTWRLSRDDLQRIDGVRASLASYRPVTNEEYLQRPPQPGNRE